jgi:hypothetical protein
MCPVRSVTYVSGRPLRYSSHLRIHDFKAPRPAALGQHLGQHPANFKFMPRRILPCPILIVVAPYFAIRQTLRYYFRRIPDRASSLFRLELGCPPRKTTEP